MALKQNRKWHSLTIDEVFKLTKSSNSGLTEQEIKIRLKKDGPNELPQQKPYSKLRLLFSQFNNPLMLILFGTIAVSIAIKHYSDTIFIVLVLLANTMVGFYQENKANDAINGLKKMIVIRTRVAREGREKEIDSKDLVAGDVVVLQAGDKIPADARLIEARGFKVNEANLTGESAAVDKISGKVAPKAVLAERKNMVFMGTLVEEGSARALVVATGLATEMGEIVRLLSETEEAQTPLQSQMARLAKLAAGFVLGVIGLILLIGLWRLNSAEDILLASLSLAVSAVPSGLLPAITLILVLGMHRILKQKGLVRKLVATETLGSVTVICTDKTGTLTEGKMAVTHLVTATKELSAKNLKYFQISDPDPISEPIKKLGKIITLNNDAFIENPEAKQGEWIIRGKITEQALLRASAQMGFDKKILEQEHLLLDKVYFSSELKYSATLREEDENKACLFVVGAPEFVLAHSQFAENPQGENFSRESVEFRKLEAKVEELGKQGLRVIAGAYIEFDTRPKYKQPHELVKNLTLVGLIALEDPIRAEVQDSIKLTKRAGIKTVIVTGDHKLTAIAIAKKIGIKADITSVMEGNEIENMTDKDLIKKVSKITIFVRVSPKHKLRIVDALQANGEIVAMVGDGVNDAPALKTANIGVAVGSGTDVAKEVADLLLLDNGFHTIVKAIEQGRIIFSNIRKVFVYLIADDFAELFIFLASMLMGLPLPLMPAMILWINLVEDGLPDLALTTEQEGTYVMDHPPRKHGEPIVSKPIRKWLIALLLIGGLSAFTLFFVGLRMGVDEGKIRTMVFALMGWDSLVFAFSVRSFHKSIFRRDIFSNRFLVAGVLVSLMLLLMAIYAPFMQRMLTTQSLSMMEWTVIVGVSLFEILLIEFTKKKFVAGRP